MFQVHGIDGAERVIVRRQLRRRQVMGFFEALAPCLVGMEACATSHHLAHELTKLGHEVCLMTLSLCTCCRHYPGAAAGRTASLTSPIRISLPRKGRRVGLRIVLFEMLWGGGEEIVSHRR